MVFRRKKMVRFYQRKIFSGPMIDTIGQKLQIFNGWIHAISSQHDR
jgi:hypothetical protein